MTESTSTTHAPYVCQASARLRSPILRLSSLEATPAPAAAHPLAGLPESVHERVLELLDTRDAAALLCVSKAGEALVRASRHWLLLRFLREPGAEHATALDHVLRCIVEEETVDGLAAVHMVCKDFHLAACPLLRLRFTITRSLQLGQAMLDTPVGGEIVAPPRPRVSFRPPSPTDAEEE